MSLLDMPSEILSLIFENLAAPRPQLAGFNITHDQPDRSTLLSLTRVSRRLNTYAIPLLYRYLSFTTSRSENDWAPMVLIREKEKKLCLLRTMIETPAMRSHVQVCHHPSLSAMSVLPDEFWSPKLSINIGLMIKSRILH